MSSTAANYEIENGVPIPVRNCRYPFGSMAVGDSFALADSSLKELERVRSAASYFGIRHTPQKFSIRRADPITKEYRCWRVA